MPRLTVVVSTYNRPDALTYALRSLVRQTVRDWIALVIGDCCDDRTEAAVRNLADPRVSYFNLPERCGDQSGPNSIGAALCRTPFLAFLNHDDLLLPDHFELALGRLEATGADLCFGHILRAYVGTSFGDDPAPRFASSPARTLTVLRAFPPCCAPDYEPASAWVMRTSAYRRVGDWTDGFDLHRAPFNDWLLRACRAGLASCVPDRPTVVYPDVPNVSLRSGGVYEAEASVQRLLDETTESRDPEAFRAFAMLRGVGGRAARTRLWWRRHGTLFEARPGVFARAVALRILRPLLPAALSPLAWLYLFTGRDAYTGFCRLLGRRPGDGKKWLLRRRTGSDDVRPLERNALLEAARTAFGDLS